MAVSPNTTCKNFCVWLQATAWLEITTPQNSIITTVYTAANAGTTVTDNVWNNFLRTTGLWYQYYTAYLAQTINSASLPANIVQGDLLYGSAANTLSRLAKSATANSFLKNSGTTNNPAWAVPATTDLSDVTVSTYTPTVANVANCTGATADVTCRYLKIGTQVIVYFEFFVTQTTTLLLTQASISIPVTVSANFTSFSQMSGSCTAANNNTGSTAAATIYAQGGNKLALISFTNAIGTGIVQRIFGSFAYIIF